MPAKAPPRPAEGVEFPKDAEGNRSTMGINKAAFSSALGGFSPDGAKKIDELPDRKWRKAYQKHVVEQVRESAKSPEAALSIARAGLEFLHNSMVFVRPAGDDTAISLEQAMAKFTGKKFITHEIQGGAPRVEKYTVQCKPWCQPGPLKELSGDALRQQIDQWVQKGVIESSCGVALTRVVDNSEWCDLRDCYVVLFGATSAMGPFYKLMDLGANVVALDLDRPPIWEKLLKETRSRAGKLIFPVKEAIPEGASDADIAKVAGCNLLTDTPEIRTWLQEIYPNERLVCMALAYLDGALFVKVSMAMDAIISSLIEKRGADKMGCAYLCTPTDAHLCTSASVEAAKSNFRRAPAWQKMLAPLLNMLGIVSKKNVEKPITNDEGVELDGLHVVDCIVPEQGPNYILAKRLQHWRAIVSRESGCIVSSNIAPSTATASVLSNVLFALGFKGMPAFRPMEITYQETSNSVMAALLIRDLRDPTSAANPKTRLANPLSLFSDAAFHGGAWRCGWKFQSIGGQALIGYVFPNFVVNPYLLFYSMYQCIACARVFMTVATIGMSLNLWSEVGPLATFVQQLSMMEVLHAAIGLSRSSPLMTFVQIFSRVYLVALVNECPSYVNSDAIWIPCMLLAWSLADFTRYLYYSIGTFRDILTASKGVAAAMKLVKIKSVEAADDPVFNIPFPLVWLRYSLFMILYPIGVFSELSIIRMTFGAVAEPLAVTPVTNINSWLLQSSQLLVGRSTWFYAGAIGVAYGLGLPSLMMMLLGSRKKQLAPKSTGPKSGTGSTKKSQ